MLTTQLNIRRKWKNAFTYITNILIKQGYYLKSNSLDNLDLNQLKLREGKSYKYGVVEYKNVLLLFRVFRENITIFTKVTDIEDDRFSKYESYMYTIHTDQMTELNRDTVLDRLHSNSFYYLNQKVKEFIESIQDPANKRMKSYDPEDSYIEFNNIVRNNFDLILSVDKFIFCLEELTELYTELFAENTMVDWLSKFSESSNFTDKAIITEIKGNTLDDKDIHFTGLGLRIENKRTKEAIFNNVYKLTMYYMKEILSYFEKNEISLT